MAESTSSGSKKDMVPINVRDAFGKDPFFSSTWDEFDQMRSDMMSRNKQFWSKVDDDFANFDDTVRKSHEEMDRQMAPFQPQLPSWAIPDDLRSKWTRQESRDGNEVKNLFYEILCKANGRGLPVRGACPRPPPPVFGRSVNPIQGHLQRSLPYSNQRGWVIMPTTFILAPQIFGPSAISELLNENYFQVDSIQKVLKDMFMYGRTSHIFKTLKI